MKLGGYYIKKRVQKARPDGKASEGFWERRQIRTRYTYHGPQIMRARGACADAPWTLASPVAYCWGVHCLLIHPWFETRA